MKTELIWTSTLQNKDTQIIKKPPYFWINNDSKVVLPMPEGPIIILLCFNIKFKLLKTTLFLKLK
ncbi:hypothetical protein [Spiroplasma endosymbiont of Cleonymus obscurus]|uniref:hypothetical protein n=1 Tax=Spiroplasma endosymbiont of Cleonymus obscurus TaxID=3066324 RepID=UPI0037DD49D4